MFLGVLSDIGHISSAERRSLVSPDVLFFEHLPVLAEMIYANEISRWPIIRRFEKFGLATIFSPYPAANTKLWRCSSDKDEHLLAVLMFPNQKVLPVL